MDFELISIICISLSFALVTFSICIGLILDQIDDLKRVSVEKRWTIIRCISVSIAIFILSCYSFYYLKGEWH